jgi:hypothetical protein
MKPEVAGPAFSNRQQCSKKRPLCGVPGHWASEEHECAILHRGVGLRSRLHEAPDGLPMVLRSSEIFSRTSAHGKLLRGSNVAGWGSTICTAVVVLSFPRCSTRVPARGVVSSPACSKLRRPKLTPTTQSLGLKSPSPPPPPPTITRTQIQSPHSPRAPIPTFGSHRIRRDRNRILTLFGGEQRSDIVLWFITT